VEMCSCLGVKAVFCFSSVQNKTIEPHILEHIYASSAQKRVSREQVCAHRACLRLQRLLARRGLRTKEPHNRHLSLHRDRDTRRRIRAILCARIDIDPPGRCALTASRVWRALWPWPHTLQVGLTGTAPRRYVRALRCSAPRMRSLRVNARDNPQSQRPRQHAV
jgi:hypothetical protein